MVSMAPQIWTPHDYQWRAGTFAAARPGAALFLDPGLGKTSITLAVINGLIRTGLIRRALVVAPLRPLYSTWPTEIARWSQFNGLRVSIIHGSPEDRTAALLTDADIYLINPAGVQWLAQEENDRFRDFGFLAVDESTKFKNPKVKAKKQEFSRWGSLRKILPEFKRRVILTGTPMPNTMIDLWTQIYICDFGERLGRTISAYRDEFFEPGPRFQTWHLKYGAKEEIEKRIADITLVLRARDNLEMPDLSFNDINVRLPPQIYRAYKKLDRELVFEMERFSLEELASNAGSKYNMTRQIANGGLYYDRDDPAGRKSAHVHDAKLDAIEDLAEELHGKPLMVVYHFEHELNRLRQRFGNVPAICGGVSASKTDGIVRQWNACEIPLLLCQPQAMSHGLNMQTGGRDQCWLGMTDNLENYLQTIARLWRQGQTGGVTVHRILAEGTVDQRMVQRSAEKEKEQDDFTQSLIDKQR